MSYDTAGTALRCVTPHPPAIVRPNKWWTLAAVSTATFMLLLDVTVVNVALPYVQRDLHAGFSDLQWVLDAYALTLAAFLLAGGTLADQFGRKRVFGTGLAVFTVASLLCGLAPNVGALDAARALQGIGGAVMYSVAPAILSNEFRGRQLGIAFGISGGVTGLAVAVGPLLGGLLTTVSWRWVFLLNVPIGVLVGLNVVVHVRESRDSLTRSVDWPGVGTFSLALTALVFGLIRGASNGWTSPVVLGFFGNTAILIGLFIVVESRRTDPMLDLRLVRNRSFDGLAATTVAVNGAINAALLFQVLYAQYVLGLSALQTGERFLPMTGVVFFAAAFAGTMSTKVPARLFVGLGGCAVGAGLLMVGTSHLGTSWAPAVPGLVVAGLGLGLFNPARAAAAVAMVPLRQAGMSSGISETFQQVGVVLGVAALGSAARSRMQSGFAASYTGVDRHGVLASLVSSGRIQDAFAAAPPSARPAVADAAHHALIDGLRLVLDVGGGFAVAGGIAGVLLVRGRDLRAARQ